MQNQIPEVVLIDEQPVKYHKTISTLPFFKFQECDVEQNLSALTISGNPTPEELSLAWIDIQQEYNTAIGDLAAEVQCELFKEVATLAANYRLVQIAVQGLRIVYAESLVRVINETLNRSLVFNYSDQVEYRQQLNKALSYSKNFKLQYKMKSKALELMQEKKEQKEGTQKKTSYEYYQGLLITLSDHSKYEVNDRISTFQFCERLKRYRNHYQAKKAQTK